MLKQLQTSNASKTKSTKKVADPFTAAVEHALKKFNDPAWLGEKSPLATPYFLASHLDAPLEDKGMDATARGNILQRILHQATEALATQHAKWGSFWAQLLDLRYLRARPVSVLQAVDALSTSKAAFDRHKSAAIEQLGQIIIQQVKPALRLEMPVPAETVLGRSDELRRCVTELQNGQSIGLSGPAGVGKTTLGVMIANEVAPQQTFWYTFTPGLNDQMSSLFFALAFFLHEQGASTLWSQFVADRNALNDKANLNILRHELLSLEYDQVLFCFDEVDLLRPSEVESHTKLVPFLETLCALAPTLLIGQKLTVETDSHYTLIGLTEPTVGQLLHSAGITLSQSQLLEFYGYTQGNPRLIELFIASYHSARRATGNEDRLVESLDEALRNFAQAPSLEFLLRRIWKHLNETEMWFFELLSVCRNAVPRPVWASQSQQVALDQLITWRLLHVDGQGGVTLLAAFKEAIYQSLLTIEEKELLHLEAANLRAQLGQFTAAAYHYAAGGEPVIAFRLFDKYGEQEIDQGQAETALALLQSISIRYLSKADQEKLSLRRAELLNLLGQGGEAQEILQKTYWRIPFLQAQAQRLEGDIAELRGDVRQAKEAYNSGLATVDQLLVAAGDIHRDLGYLHVKEGEYADAEREGVRLRYEAANLDGTICELQGDLVGAESAYQEALQFAVAANYSYGEANTHGNLGRVHAWRRQLAQAEEHLQQAITFFENTGRLSKLASATYNLALARRLAEEYETAIQPAQEALHLFEQLEEEYGCALANQILAEIHLGLHQLDQAEEFVRRALEVERTGSQPDGLRTLGEIRLQQGHADEAEKLAQQSLHIAQANEDPILEGYAYRALGKIYQSRSLYSLAHKNFAKAAHIFHGLGLAEYEKVPTPTLSTES